MEDGSASDAGLQTEGRGLEGENAVASDYIIVLPLSALKPDPLPTSGRHNEKRC